jgi:glycosyltransferase involved in cell wall biosynthesis
VIGPSFYYTFSKLGLGFLNIINYLFIKKLISKNTTEKTIAIACNGLLEPYLDRELFDVICYDHLDSLDIHLGSSNYNLTKKLHNMLLEKSDIVFVTADKLKQEVESQYPGKTVVMVTNGVDCDFFSKNKNSYAVPDYIKSTRPIVGYIGAIWDWINVELVHEVARLSPEIDYLMIGPVSTNNEVFVDARPDNVYYLGRKPYDMIPAYLDLFDVAIIPFVSGDISESTDPIKLYEYFALGKPVVTTNMRQLRKFNDGTVLRMVNDPIEFVKAVRSFIECDSAENKIRREKLAQDNSWHNKASLMIEAIERHISMR